MRKKRPNLYKTFGTAPSNLSDGGVKTATVIIQIPYDEGPLLVMSVG